MDSDKYNLSRFLEPQEWTYSTALQELQEGRKRSHWMWHIFPQLSQLGHSYFARILDKYFKGKRDPHTITLLKYI